MLLKTLFLFIASLGLHLSAWASLHPDIENLLIANNFKSVGHLQIQPDHECYLQVIPPKGEPSDKNPYWLKARSTKIWMVAYPGDKWELDLRQSTLKRLIGGNEAWYMIYHFNPGTLKFTRFYEVASSQVSLACILGE
jgi:hypothetical protein